MIHRTNIILLTFFTIFISNSIAQVNIEKYNNLNSTNGLNGNLSFYISSKTGNTDIQEFEIDGRINLKGDKYYSFLIGQGEYGWNKGKEYSNNALLHFRYIREINYIFNPEFFSQINYNKSRLLLFRSLAGIGLRTTLISDSNSNFTYGTAYMYEYENLDIDKRNKTYHHRWSNYISYSALLSKTSRLSIVIYAQPRFDDFSDIRMLSENHLGVGLTDKLSLSINFSLMYYSEPPIDVKKLDTNTKVGLTIKL
ncbi:MAG: DUF481 domain-containing protein [Melioribacteraceae bacterium]|nr:DUF481 domain-containing protein [Melioribacteraceae bacterium]